MMGEREGCVMNAKPLMEATAKISLIPNSLKSKKEGLMFSVLKPIDIIRTIVEMIRAPIA